MQFVFDLDGTICFKGQPFSSRLLSCFERLVDEGHEIIFASARPIRDMLPVVNPRFHNHILIGGNGSLIYHESKIVHVSSFQEEQMRLIMESIQKYDATYLIDSDWDYSYTGAADHPILNNLDTLKSARNVPFESLGRVVKVLLLSSSNMEHLSESLIPLDIVMHKHSDEDILDISPNHIHKWSALQKVGLQAKQFIAFGNDANDICMFKEALHSVRIGSHPELGEYASETIVLEGDYEGSMISKIEELSRCYS